MDIIHTETVVDGKLFKIDIQTYSSSKKYTRDILSFEKIERTLFNQYYKNSLLFHIFYENDHTSSIVSNDNIIYPCMISLNNRHHMFDNSTFPLKFDDFRPDIGYKLLPEHIAYLRIWAVLKNDMDNDWQFVDPLQTPMEQVTITEYVPECGLLNMSDNYRLAGDWFNDEVLNSVIKLPNTLIMGSAINDDKNIFFMAIDKFARKNKIKIIHHDHQFILNNNSEKDLITIITRQWKSIERIEKKLSKQSWCFSRKNIKIKDIKDKLNVLNEVNINYYYLAYESNTYAHMIFGYYPVISEKIKNADIVLFDNGNSVNIRIRDAETAVMIKLTMQEIL